LSAVSSTPARYRPTTGLARALSLFQRTATNPARPRRVTPGAIADLLLLGDPVAVTIVGGRIIFG
jgi:hypothetical protein